MITLNKTIRLFLDSIGRRDEYEFYLDKFQSEHSACFALLCPDLESIEAGAEVLAFDLHFLLRLELVPAILLCGRDAARMEAALAVERVFEFQSLQSASAIPFIQQARSAEKVPVLVAEDVALETALMQLIPDVAKRVHFIRAAGGLKAAGGDLLPYVYTHTENFQPLEPLEYDFPALGKKLLAERPGVHLSVTSPINLLQEIFTVKGAGTLFRKGSVIEHFETLDQIDLAALLNLLETSFGKKLRSKDFLDNVADAYLEKDYRGAVLLEEHPSGLYLSKFAVGREARGEGVAMELWRKVCDNHGALFWRSNVSNPFNSWYHNQADGHHASGKWQIFWRGVSADAISGIIEYCCSRDEDFSLSDT
jgi:acetylglutamate kinase